MKNSLKLSALILVSAFLMTACGAAAPASTPPAGGSVPAAADSKWPEREIRMIIPYAEGGGSHKTALTVKGASDSIKALAQPFVVVCMPNAATLEGQEEVLNAKPDGYTAMIHHNAMINNFALGKQDFTYTDFRMVGQLYETPLAIAVRKDSPFNTIDELVAGIKANPGKYSWTWAGIGGNTHFASYVFYNAAGIDPKSVVPCITKGDGDSIVNLLGGTADIAIAQTNAYLEFVKSGDVKVLGHSGEGEVDISGAKVKSWKDLGYNDSYNLRCFVFLPKSTPDETVAQFAQAIEKIVASDEFNTKMTNDGLTPKFLSEEDAIAAFAKEAESANRIAALINAK